MELLLPSTFAINERDNKLLVYRIGNLARTASIFGVDTITIYRDRDSKADEARNAELVEKYLRYAECPPYLRKALIPHDPDLKYANILPPLQILSHGYEDDFREGVVTESSEDGSVVDIGLNQPVTIDADVEQGSRVTLMKLDDGWQLIDYRDMDGFWTFRVENDRRSLGEILAERDHPIIGTSAKAEPLSAFKTSNYVEEDIGLVFGSAWRGIYELIDRGDCRENQFDAIYNFVPDQHDENGTHNRSNRNRAGSYKRASPLNSS